MKRDRVAPEYDELCAGLVERYEHVVEIIGELDHQWAPTNTQGI